MADVTEIKGVFNQYREVCDTIKQLEGRRDFLKKHLIEALAGDVEGSINGAVAYTYKTVISHRVDTTALKAAMPDIAQRFTKASSSTALRIINDESVEQ